MRFPRLIASLALSLNIQAAAFADLGGADITGPSGQTTTGQSYMANCGIKKSKCEVAFTNEKLTVNGSEGIYRDQFVNVVKTRACTQRALLLPFVTSCFENQYDWDFTITYKASDGTQRSALISFMPRYLSTGATDRAMSFERDLQVWMQDVLRPIGPSIEVQPPRSPIQTRPQ